eukprot:2023623-Prymnesium_polylepis.4
MHARVLCSLADGRKYQVGDEGNMCYSVACQGGMQGGCYPGEAEGSFRKVLCEPKKWVDSIANNQVVDNDPTVGAWGGECRCPDGNVYLAGDEKDGEPCGSLACEGGEPGICNHYESLWKGVRVKCDTSVNAPGPPPPPPIPPPAPPRPPPSMPPPTPRHPPPSPTPPAPPPPTRPLQPPPPSPPASALSLSISAIASAISASRSTISSIASAISSSSIAGGTTPGTLEASSERDGDSAAVEDDQVPSAHDKTFKARGRRKLVATMLLIFACFIALAHIYDVPRKCTCKRKEYNSGLADRAITPTV